MSAYPSSICATAGSAYEYRLVLKKAFNHVLTIDSAQIILPKSLGSATTPKTSYFSSVALMSTEPQGQTSNTSSSSTSTLSQSNMGPDRVKNWLKENSNNKEAKSSVNDMDAYLKAFDDRMGWKE